MKHAARAGGGAPDAGFAPPAASGGGGAVGVVFLVLFLLALIGGAVFWTVRQRRAGQPIMPTWLRGLSPFGARAQTRPELGVFYAYKMLLMIL